ncbi:MAG: rod shape-determining protein RodA [Schleiferiaceae bacterium]
MQRHVQSNPLVGRLDRLTVGLVVFLVLFGWVNIFATVSPIDDTWAWSWSNEAGKQLSFIGLASVLVLLVLLSDARLFEVLAWVVYGLSLILLVAVLAVGVERGGNKSWLSLGSFGLQPSEFAKLGTALVLARILGRTEGGLKQWRARWLPFGVVGLPMLLVLLQPDAGSALVFMAFLLVLYFAGLPGFYLFGVLGIGVLSVLALALSDNQVHWLIGSVVVLSLVATRARKRLTVMRFVRHPAIWLGLLSLLWAGAVQQVFDQVLKPHQQIRIKLLLGQVDDPSAAGYQTAQSLIAIGSGGLFGKGYMNGPQTRLRFVPEQTTDYIFCTVGEEWGFLGSLVVLGAFAGLIIRITLLAQRQKHAFGMYYGLGVASILFVHFAVNVGMTLGLMPVIGIPLPFFSYGGSSLWAFSLLVFVFLRWDAYRWESL